MESAETIAVVLLNLGGPASEAAVPDFLRRLLSDPEVVPLPFPLRPALARWIAWRRSPKVRGYYRLIGGRSPIAAQTREQVEALRVALGDRYVVRYAFRHSPPFTADVLSGLAEAGVKRAVALPAYPHFSRTTTGSAMKEFRRAARRYGIAVRGVGAYPDAPGYIQALAEGVRERWMPGTHVVASAHGLPQTIVDRGDPYVDDVRKTVAALRARLPGEIPLRLAFQSRLGRSEWTRPYLLEEIERLSREGVRSLVVVPLSFAVENLETSYELDIQVAEWARECGITEYRRVPVPGTHPAFLCDLAEMVHREADRAGWSADERREVLHGA